MASRVLGYTVAAVLGAVVGFSIANLDVGTLGQTDFSRWGPDAWSALATGVTALIAAAAAVFAFHQLGEARSLRREQAQPYVVVAMETDTRDPKLVYIVIKNHGLTGAKDVRLQVQPSPGRSPDMGGGAVWLPPVIPFMAPGQSWTTLWDFSPARSKVQLPARHDATVFFTDSHGGDHTSTATLDWGAYLGREWVTRRTIHDTAEALRELVTTAGRWSENIHGGLAVFTRDGDLRDAEQRESLEQLRAERERHRHPPPPSEPGSEAAETPS